MCTMLEILDNGDSESHTKKKTKRMRTTFTEEQVQILQANFQIDSNPDGQDLERIAQITGLSKRVTQVKNFGLLAKTNFLQKYCDAGLVPKLSSASEKVHQFRQTIRLGRIWWWQQ